MNETRDHLQRRQVRGLLLLMAACAILLLAALWRHGSARPADSSIPQEVMDEFNRVTAFSDTTAPAGRQYSDTDKKRSSPTKKKKPTRSHKSAAAKSAPSAPARDITSEDL